MRFYIIFYTCFVFIGCDFLNESIVKETEDATMNQPLRSLKTLKEMVLNNGDTDAYYELSIAYLNLPYQEEFLLYAMIMANKYDYPQAYFDVFDCFVLSFWPDISKIDEQSANLAIEYLIKAHDRGHHQATEIVHQFSIKKNESSKKQIYRIFGN